MSLCLYVRMCVYIQDAAKKETEMLALHEERLQVRNQRQTHQQMELFYQDDQVCIVRVYMDASDELRLNVYLCARERKCRVSLCVCACVRIRHLESELNCVHRRPDKTSTHL